MNDNPSFLLSQQQADAWHQGAPSGHSGQAFQVAVRLDAHTTIPDLERSVSLVAARHEILRTTYAAAPGRSVGVQMVHDVLAVPVRSVEGTLDEVLAAEMGPFGLDASPLRIAVVGAGNSDALLVVTL